MARLTSTNEAPTTAQIQQAMERILASPQFAKAGRQSRFLAHVVEKHLAGDAAALREIAIAWDVYERPPDYDPKADPIVRVEASRLRARLKKYYESEGASDAVRIDLPKFTLVGATTRQGLLIIRRLAASPSAH